MRNSRVGVCGGTPSTEMSLSLRTALLDSLLFTLAVQFVLTEGGKVHVIGSSDKLRSFGFLYHGHVVLFRTGDDYTTSNF